MLLFLVSTLFGLFVVAIMIDQLHAIFQDETKIGTSFLKERHFKFKLLANIFGRIHPFFWFFPCIETKTYDIPLINHDV